MIMNKKDLASRTLKVGKDRITFVRARLDEIKEAITKQDISDLLTSGAIKTKPIKGRRKNVKRKHKRGPGKVKKKVKKRKQEYVKITRKLRKHLKIAKDQGEISSRDLKEIRKGIRNKNFKSKASLKQKIQEIKK